MSQESIENKTPDSQVEFKTSSDAKAKMIELINQLNAATDQITRERIDAKLTRIEGVFDMLIAQEKGREAARVKIEEAGTYAKDGDNLNLSKIDAASNNRGVNRGV